MEVTVLAAMVGVTATMVDGNGGRDGSGNGGDK